VYDQAAAVTEVRGTELLQVVYGRGPRGIGKGEDGTNEARGIMSAVG